MIAITRQQIVVRPKELVGDFFYYRIDFFLGSKGEALEDVAAPSAAGRFEVRFGPVDTCDTATIVSSVGVLFAAYYDAGMEEASANGPEEGRQAAGLHGVL